MILIKTELVKVYRLESTLGVSFHLEVSHTRFVEDIMIIVKEQNSNIFTFHSYLFINKMQHKIVFTLA